MLDKHGDAGTYFDTSAFSQPRGVTFGNTGRNQFRGPGAWNLDFSLFRAFPIMGGTKRIEFRSEFFNLLNHPNWGNPDHRLYQLHLRPDVHRRDRRHGMPAPASARSASGFGSSSKHRQDGLSG